MFWRVCYRGGKPMSRRSLMVLTVVFVVLVLGLIGFFSTRGQEKEQVSSLDSTPVVSLTAVVLTQPTATPAFVPAGTAVAQPTETAVTSTTVPVATRVPTAQVPSSPTPVSTPLPLVAVTTVDISGDNIADLKILGGYSGQEKKLTHERPLDLKDAPQPKGVGYYGVFKVGSRGVLAMMTDITDPSPEGLQNPGTFYVGRELNGSLADAYAYSLVRSQAVEINSYAIDFGEEGSIPITIRIVVQAERAYPASTEGTPLPQREVQPVSAVSVGIQTVSVRVARIPETDRFFVLQERSGYGMFKSLGDVVVLQDLNNDGKVIGDWPETQQSSTILIEGKWIIHSISSSGRTVFLLSRENAVLAGFVQK